MPVIKFISNDGDELYKNTMDMLKGGPEDIQKQIDIVRENVREVKIKSKDGNWMSISGNKFDLKSLNAAHQFSEDTVPLTTKTKEVLKTALMDTALGTGKLLTKISSKLPMPNLGPNAGPTALVPKTEKKRALKELHTKMAEPVEKQRKRLEALTSGNTTAQDAFLVATELGYDTAMALTIDRILGLNKLGAGKAIAKEVSGLRKALVAGDKAGADKIINRVVNSRVFNEAIGGAAGGATQMAIESGGNPLETGKGALMGFAGGGVMGKLSARSGLAKEAARGRLPYEFETYFDVHKIPEVAPVIQQLRETGKLDDKQIIGHYILYKNGPRKKGQSFNNYLKDLRYEAAEGPGYQLQTGVTEYYGAATPEDFEGFRGREVPQGMIKPTTSDEAVFNAYKISRTQKVVEGGPRSGAETIEPPSIYGKQPLSLPPATDFEAGMEGTIPKRSEDIDKWFVSMSNDQKRRLGIEIIKMKMRESPKLLSSPTAFEAGMEGMIPKNTPFLENWFRAFTSDLVRKGEMDKLFYETFGPQPVKRISERAQAPRFEGTKRGFRDLQNKGTTYIDKQGRVADDTGRILFQDYSKLRGQIKFNPDDGTAVVTAFKSADVSTFSHETAHYWRRNLPDDVQRLLETEYGVKGGAWTDAQEEAFSRNFEKYLAEGKAPNGRLQPLFNDYKKWIGDVYKDVDESPLSENISDNMREVFHRMLSGGFKAKPKKLAKLGAVAVEGGKAIPRMTIDEADKANVDSAILFQNDKITRIDEYNPWYRQTKEEADLEYEQFSEFWDRAERLEKVRSIDTYKKRRLSSEKLFQAARNDRPWGQKPPVMDEVKYVAYEQMKAIREHYSGKRDITDGVIKWLDQKLLSASRSVMNRLDPSGKLYGQAQLLLNSRRKGIEAAFSHIPYVFEPVKGQMGTWKGEEKPLAEIAAEVGELIRGKNYKEKGLGLPESLTTDMPVREREWALFRARNPQQAQAIEESLKRFHETYSGKTLRYLVAKGALSEEGMKYIEKANPFYLAFYREIEESLTKQGGELTGNRTLKVRKGGLQELKDPFVNTINNMATFVAWADKNALVRDAIDAAAAKGLAKPVSTIRTGLKSVDMDGVRKVFIPKEKLADNELMVKRGDAWETWRIDDPDLLKLFKFKGAPDRWDINALRFMKDVKRIGITATATFLERNFVRDGLQRVLNDPNLLGKEAGRFWNSVAFYPVALKKFAYDYPAAFMRIVAHDRPELQAVLERAAQRMGKEYDAGVYGNIRKAGATSSLYFGHSEKDIIRAIDRAAGIKRQGGKGGQFLDVVVQAPGNLYKYIDNVLGILEQVPRLDYADQVFKQTGSMDEAIRGFSNITANFAEKGYVSKGWYGDVAPFFSASMAGAKAEMDAFKKDPVVFAAKIAQLTAASVLLWYKNKDTDWYQGLSNTDKNMYWHLGKTGNKIIRIPKAYGLGTIMGTSGVERLLEAAKKEDPDAVEGFFKALEMSLPGIGAYPVLGTQAYGMAVGKDPFFGSKIDPYFSENDYPFERVKPNTSRVARALAGMNTSDNAIIGKLSPAMIDFLISDTTGTLGRSTVSAVDWFYNKGTGAVVADRFPKAATQQQDPMETVYSDHLGTFYDNMSAGEAAYSAITDEYNSNGNHSSVFKKLSNEKGWQYHAYSDEAGYNLKDYKKAISDRLKKYKEIQDPQNKTLTGREKAEAMKILAVEMNMLAIQANKMYEQKRAEWESE